MLKSPHSCFIDCCELAFKAKAEVIDETYRSLCQVDAVDGYHTGVVNVIFFEAYGVGLTEVDFLPVTPDGEPIAGMDHITRGVSNWFKRPKFSCVVTGPRKDGGEEHANAFVGGRFICPVEGALDEPNIKLRSLWCLTVPKLRSEEEAE
jgi:hypothetical protein